MCPRYDGIPTIVPLGKGCAVDSSVVNLISVGVALVAVAVAVWQVRTSTERAERALSLPIITEIAREIRSSEFRQNFIYLQNTVLPVPDSGGFESLPEEFREQAYQICYFFDYLGILVLYGIITEDMVVDWVGTRLVLIWATMRPFIEAEREHRRITYPPETPPGFLLHFEHLIKETERLNTHHRKRMESRLQW
jgi:hypothetical protein